MKATKSDPDSTSARRLARCAGILVVFALSQVPLNVIAQSVDWSRTPFADRYSTPYGLVADHQGSVYFAGDVVPGNPPQGTTTALFLIKYNSSGQSQWQQPFPT